VYKLIPGADPKILDFAGDHYHGIIIESFGVGGIPCYENTDFQAALQRVLEKQVAVVMTTQVPHEGSDMDVYEVGHRAKEELGLIEAYDMTLEALTAKLMWILGQTREPDQIRKLFYTPVAHDISE
jgi:L-asparaginase